MPGSSENFENFEYEFEDVTKSISRKLNSQLPNYTGGACDSFGPFSESAGGGGSALLSALTRAEQAR